VHLSTDRLHQGGFVLQSVNDCVESIRRCLIKGSRACVGGDSRYLAGTGIREEISVFDAHNEVSTCYRCKDLQVSKNPHEPVVFRNWHCHDEQANKGESMEKTNWPAKLVQNIESTSKESYRRSVDSINLTWCG
jgi:hypothetical protein